MLPPTNNPDLTAAEARAARNGLSLETGDVDAGYVWPRQRYVFVRLMSGRQQVASMTASYRAGDEAAKSRALCICLTRVYYRPDGPAERP